MWPAPTNLKEMERLSTMDTSYRSTASLTGQISLSFVLYILGYFTKGMTWMLSAALSAANAGFDAVLYIRRTVATMQLIVFMMADVAYWEKAVYTTMTPSEAHLTMAMPKEMPKTCDIVESAAQGQQPCGVDEVCMRGGIFFGRDCENPTMTGCTRKGFCIKATRPELLPCSFCVQDSDCISGVCLLEEADDYGAEPKWQEKKYDAWVHQVARGLGGTCRVPCEPGKDGCTVVPGRDFGVEVCEEGALWKYIGRSIGFNNAELENLVSDLAPEELVRGVEKANLSRSVWRKWTNQRKSGNASKLVTP